MHVPAAIFPPYLSTYIKALPAIFNPLLNERTYVKAELASERTSLSSSCNEELGTLPLFPCPLKEKARLRGKKRG
nr:hypothetical protein Q903MT_gene347 [Picea sitchensis]